MIANVRSLSPPANAFHTIAHVLWFVMKDRKARTQLGYQSFSQTWCGRR